MWKVATKVTFPWYRILRCHKPYFFICKLKHETFRGSINVSFTCSLSRIDFISYSNAISLSNITFSSPGKIIFLITTTGDITGTLFIRMCYKVINKNQIASLLNCKNCWGIFKPQQLNHSTMKQFSNSGTESLQQAVTDALQIIQD